MRLARSPLGQILLNRTSQNTNQMKAKASVELLINKLSHFVCSRQWCSARRRMTCVWSWSSCPTHRWRTSLRTRTPPCRPRPSSPSPAITTSPSTSGTTMQVRSLPSSINSQDNVAFLLFRNWFRVSVKKVLLEFCWQKCWNFQQFPFATPISQLCLRTYIQIREGRFLGKNNICFLTLQCCCCVENCTTRNLADWNPWFESFAHKTRSALFSPKVFSFAFEQQTHRRHHPAMQRNQTSSLNCQSLWTSF